jgi:cytoskeletal protein RodZ
MTGRPLKDSIGVGPALERARLIRGLSLEEAARDTKLRVDQLTALEQEEFEALPGDVFIRGSLRTYAQYVGLSPDKVLAMYGRHTDDPQAPPPPGRLGRVEQAIAATRIRDNQRLLLVLAASVLGILLIFGLVSRDHAAPEQAAISVSAAAPPSEGPTIDVVLVALAAADVTVVVDGVEGSHSMAEGETLSFSAAQDLGVTVDDGGSVQVVVDGRDLGAPGEPGRPWSKTFRVGIDEASATPSADAGVSPTGSPPATASEGP